MKFHINVGGGACVSAFAFLLHVGISQN